MKRATLLGAALLAGCAATPAATTGTTGTPVPAPSTATRADTGDATLLPVGFGTLRQQDLALRLSLTGGATAQLLPLDESFLRLLAPDSYRTLRDLRESRRVALDSIAQRFRLPRYSLWYVSFYGQEQGEARFSPFELILSTGGREFRPLEIVPLSPGFGEQRLRQRDVKSALYVFDGSMDLNQPLEVTAEATRDATSWSATVLPRVERERALVRSRASRRPGA